MTEFFKLLIPVWGTIEWGPINWITDSFISAIVLYAILSVLWFCWKTYRRRRLIDGLAKEVPNDRPARPQITQELKEKFARNGELAEAWQEFEDSLITRQRDENRGVVYKTDEASLFFSEDRLLGQHLNLRFWNSVPALLVGLGILGTFIGLVWGLIPFSGIDFTQTDQIREAIKELLSGVSTAFVTSVWGMATSLVFNGLEKWRISRVSRAIADLQRALDQLFTLTTQEEISFRQEDELAQQTAALRSFSTDLADRIEIAMDNIMSGRLENLHQSLTQLHDQNAEGRQEIIQELHNAPEAFSSAMAEQLTPSLNNLNTAVKELRQQKEESSTAAIQQLVEEFQRSLSGSATAQMETLAETVGRASDSLITLPEQMTGMMAGVQEQIEQTRQLLSETSQEQTGQMQSMMDGMLNAFQSAIYTQQSGLSETTDRVNEEMRQIAANIRNLLESAANRTDEQLAQRMADMETVSNQSIQTLQTAIAELGQSITSTASQAATESAAMTDRMRQLFEQTANRLGESVQDAEQSVSTLLRQQGEQTEAINAQLNNWQDTLTGGREMLEQMNTSVASVHQLIETTRALSGQLTTSATQLESAGQQLTQASNAFNQENERYLTANRETTEQIQAAVGHLNNSVQRFQTIDNGLQGIFAEIERGLNEYVTTTRESINTYLTEFSSQLTQASTALAGSVEALGENVEILIERRPRR